MMAWIFRDMIAAGKLVIYMDDIIVLGKTQKELEDNMRDMLKLAEKHDLFFKPSKCMFNLSTVPFLGFIIGEGKICMDEEKVKVVKEWRRLENKKGVQKFLGFINFYRRFVKNFSKIAGPLHKLTGKNEWKWSTDQEVAFETLKEKISEEPVIAIAQANGKFRIKVDTSGYAIGAVLSQIQDDGKWHPVVFLSRTMTPAECHYEIYDKELLAIMNSITTWRQYLLGAKEPFEILTDHQNLTYFRKPQRLNQQQMGWYMKLQDYNFTWEPQGNLNHAKNLLQEFHQKYPNKPF